MFIYFVTKLG